MLQASSICKNLCLRYGRKGISASERAWNACKWTHKPPQPIKAAAIGKTAWALIPRNNAIPPASSTKAE